MREEDQALTGCHPNLAWSSLWRQRTLRLDMGQGSGVLSTEEGQEERGGGSESGADAVNNRGQVVGLSRTASDEKI